MNNQWQDITDDHRDGYYHCESLASDAPPQLLRSYRPMRFNVEDSSFSVDVRSPRVWERWTTGGWVPLVGRVCPISPRPQ